MSPTREPVSHDASKVCVRAHAHRPPCRACREATELRAGQRARRRPEIDKHSLHDTSRQLALVTGRVPPVPARSRSSRSLRARASVGLSSSNRTSSTKRRHSRSLREEHALLLLYHLVSSEWRPHRRASCTGQLLHDPGPDMASYRARRQRKAMKNRRIAGSHVQASSGQRRISFAPNAQHPGAEHSPFVARRPAEAEVVGQQRLGLLEVRHRAVAPAVCGATAGQRP